MKRREEIESEKKDDEKMKRNKNQCMIKREKETIRSGEVQI